MHNELYYIFSQNFFQPLYCSLYIFLIFMCKRCRFPRCIYPTASLPIPAIILHTMTPHTVGISAARAVHLTLPVSFFMVRSVVAHGQCIRKNTIVHSAVTQVQPFSVKRCCISARLQSSVRLPWDV